MPNIKAVNIDNNWDWSYSWEFAPPGAIEIELTDEEIAFLTELSGQRLKAQLLIDRAYERMVNQEGP